MITPSLVSKPSISTSIWLRVCSRSSWPAAVAGAAGAAHGVQLVDEQDAGRVAPALLEEVAHAAGADADEHLDEVGAGHVEEGDVRLARDGLGQQGLPRARHADEEHALGDLGAEAGELLRALEELDDLLQLVLGLVLAGHVGEGDALARVQVALGPALPEGEGLVAVSLHLAEHEPDEEEPDDPGEELDENGEGRDGLGAARDLHSLVLEGLHQVVVRVGDGRLEEVDLAGLGLQRALDLVLVDDLHLVDLAVRPGRSGTSSRGAPESV